MWADDARTHVGGTMVLAGGVVKMSCVCKVTTDHKKSDNHRGSK